MEHEVKLCNEVETVREFTYLGDRVSAGGECETAMTASTRCGWVKRRECGELLYGKRFPLKLKGAVYKLCKAAILYGSEARCMRDGNFKKVRQIHGKSNVWSAAETQKKIYGFDLNVWFE